MAQVPDALSAVPVPQKPAQQDTVRHLCRVWRNRVDFKDAYVAVAEGLESTAGLGAGNLPVDFVNELETFSAIERMLMNSAKDCVLQGDLDKAASLAQGRRNLFWSRERPGIQLRWVLIGTAADLMKQVATVVEALKRQKWTLDGLVDAYTCHAEPWMMLDRLARHLESRYAQREVAGAAEDDKLERVMSACRNAYNGAIGQLAEKYAETLLATGFRSSRMPSQTETFENVVRPLLTQGKKVAFFMVDALRYEMADELVAGMTEDFEVQIEPCLGQLPGITAVGMAALLPGANKELAISGEGTRAVVSAQGRSLKDRTARMDWLTEAAGVETVSCKLGQIAKLTPRRKKDLASAQFAIVTSQEIDRLAEEGAEEEEARLYMDEVLGKLRRGIRNLAATGFEHFVIAADHGFIFAEGLEPGLRMDPPGGDTLELHPRVWIVRSWGNDWSR